MAVTALGVHSTAGGTLLRASIPVEAGFLDHQLHIGSALAHSSIGTSAKHLEAPPVLAKTPDEHLMLPECHSHFGDPGTFSELALLFAESPISAAMESPSPQDFTGNPAAECGETGACAVPAQAAPHKQGTHGA